MLIENPLRQAVQAFDLTEHAERLQDRERDASLGLLVMVVGSGNFGKSSLINALCGRDVAAVSVIPKTFKIDVFAAGEPQMAFVRHVGESRSVKCSYDEARKIEAERERLFKDKSQKQLAEIVWQYDDLGLPPGISIVDTPGISQALGNAARGVALASVLGSTFEVDEVWARWFHRADVVIWAFCANKMEDADTKIALESALNLFDKPIIPVATKADLIPVDRWSEVVERFNNTFGPLLKDRQAGELHLTVCGGKNVELIGTGIPELRSSLEAISSESVAVKLHAEETFVRDESAAVAHVLDETARVLVSNLRSIASLGDSIAEEAIREAMRGRADAVSRVNAYFGAIRRHPRLRDIAETVHTMTEGGRAGDIETEARNRLVELIDERKIEREVNEAFTVSARSLETTAERLSHGTEIARLSFKSSGTITRHPVPLKLKLRAFAVTSRLDFSLNLKGPTGFLGRAWDAVKRFFGMDRFSIDDVHSAMSDALAVSESDLDSAMQQALREGFAPAIGSAVEQALKHHLESTDSEALELLADVDFYLAQLLPAESLAKVTTYGPQAEYWATLAPGTQTLLELAREELTSVIPDFKELLLEPFSFDSPQTFPEFGELWQERKLDAAVVTVEIEFREVLRKIRVELGEEVEGAEQPFLQQLEAREKEFLEQSPMLEALDTRLAEVVIGARYRSAGLRLAEAGARSFVGALENSTRVWSSSEQYEQILGWCAGKGTVAGTLLGIVVSIVLLLVKREIGLLCLLLTVIWWVFGLARPYLLPSVRYKEGIGQALIDEIRECQAEAAERFSTDMVDEVLRGMSAELAPRPLQKLLIESGLLFRPTNLNEDLRREEIGLRSSF